MIKPTKEQLAEALRQYPTWGHAYVAEKARADSLQEQLEAVRETLGQIAGPTQTSHRKEDYERMTGQPWPAGYEDFNQDDAPASRQGGR